MASTHDVVVGIVCLSKSKSSTSSDMWDIFVVWYLNKTRKGIAFAFTSSVIEPTKKPRHKLIKTTVKKQIHEKENNS